MSVPTVYRYNPDYAIHPGEILAERLEAAGMKKAEFAERCGLTPKTISLILSGRAPVTSETAIRFERVLGVSAQVWNNLDAQYQLFQAQKNEQRTSKNGIEWSRRFPVTQLVEQGVMARPSSDVERVRFLLDFFCVANVEAYETRFQRVAVDYRKSPAFTSSPEAIAAQLRIGEMRAEAIQALPFDRQRFVAALDEIRGLTLEAHEALAPKIVDICGAAGVAVVFVPALPKTRLSGAARWLSSEKALIMLTLRYKSDDHFWFTFFHEAAHILLHGKKDVYIDEEDMQDNKAEREANRFSAQLLIEPAAYAEFVKNGQFSERAVRRFASTIGVAPGIVVGRLQHDQHIRFSWLNSLKRRFDFTR